MPYHSSTAVSNPSRTHSRRRFALGAAAALAVASAAAWALAEPAPPAQARPNLAQMGKGAFWGIFRAGAHDRIDDALFPLTAAFLQDPTSGETALLIAHAHLWRVAERARSPKAMADPRITDSLVLARHYFQQAARLLPDDRRIDGWLASTELALGTVHGNPDDTSKGKQRLIEAWQAYPAFNGFTFGHMLSSSPRESEPFAMARKAMWSTIASCSRGTITPDAPTAPDTLDLAKAADPACWNSEKAPHNFEGFWWSVGLIEAKAGNADTARACFDNARLAPSFTSWPYREPFEADAAALDQLIESFAAAEPQAEQRLLVNAAHSCMACHQATPNRPR